MRQKGSQAIEKVKEILADSNIGCASAAQKISIALSSAKTASSMTFGNPQARSSSRHVSAAKKTNFKRIPGEQASGGEPAARMTHRERLAKLAEQEEEQKLRRIWKQLGREVVEKARESRAARKRLS